MVARAVSTAGQSSAEGKRLFEALNKIDALLLTQDLSGVDRMFTHDSVFHSDGITLPMDLEGLDGVRGESLIYGCLNRLSLSVLNSHTQTGTRHMTEMCRILRAIFQGLRIQACACCSGHQ